MEYITLHVSARTVVFRDSTNTKDQTSIY